MKLRLKLALFWEGFSCRQHLLLLDNVIKNDLITSLKANHI